MVNVGFVEFEAVQTLRKYAQTLKKSGIMNKFLY